MKITPTALPEVLLIEPQVFGDKRGFFMETFRQNTFAEAGINLPFVQDNHSGSRQSILRGMHYQIRHPQGKLVRAVAGEIFDVAVDLRRSSPNFSKWVGVNLTASNRWMIWVPPGFAHGFYVLSEWAEIAYKTTDYYAPEWERTLIWSDPTVGIHWPVLEGHAPLLSSKDSQGKQLVECELFD